MASRDAADTMAATAATKEDDPLVTALAAQLEETCHVVEFQSDEDELVTLPRIDDLSLLALHLPRICSSIYKTLGSQQQEATYQACLALDLRQAGLIVEEEVEIPLVYKNCIVGHRRADLVVTFPNDSQQRAVLELKAVHTLSPSHAKQLQYYMQHLDIDHGYLVNFPHDDGFPSITNSVFVLKSLLQENDDDDISTTLDTPTLRLRHDPNHLKSPAQVQVVQFSRLKLDTTEGQDALKAREERHLQAPKAKWGVNSSGLPCKICEEDQDYCRYHKDQVPLEEEGDTEVER